MMTTNSILRKDFPSLTNTTYSRVRERLRQDILTNYFPSGKRLKIHELVKLYNVSQMPIREALQQLQGEGLVVIEQHKGAYVRQVDRKYISDIFDIRRILEVFLTLESLKYMSDELVLRLRKIQDNYIIAARKKDFKGIIKYNEQFHTLIYKVGDNDEAFRLLQGRWQLLNSIRLSYGYGDNRFEEVIEEHEAIFRAIELRDREALEKAAFIHSMNAKADLLKQVDNFAA